MTLQELFEKVTSRWQFTEKSYPILRTLPTVFHRHFAMNHIIQHEIKAINRVVRLLEADEHINLDKYVTLEYENKADILEAVWRMQVNLLKLADRANITSEEIENKIQEYLDKE
jgi:hypothetical protein